MKMADWEKSFVNSRRNSERVARKAEAMLRFVEPRAGERYLDFGYGNGAAAIRVARDFALDVTGIDVDPDQIRAAEVAAQGVPSARFLAVDGTRLPFADGEFDIVATNKVTHHIADWEGAVAEMIRVLRPGGHLIYGDFVLPGMVAGVLKKVLRSHGAPTVTALDRLAAVHSLAPVHVSKGALHFQAVWRKAAA